mmetsp:Transcript_88114/g.139241  ORF Transcript_88114/g.139241 Transcript_88114/m.139241 type:complete len:219 (+) Transcript_88114:1034-1690(+)
MRSASSNNDFAQRSRACVHCLSPCLVNGLSGVHKLSLQTLCRASACRIKQTCFCEQSNGHNSKSFNLCLHILFGDLLSSNDFCDAVNFGLVGASVGLVGASVESKESSERVREISLARLRQATVATSSACIKVEHSTPHTPVTVFATTDARRGELYIKANSPKAWPSYTVVTTTSLTIMSNSPLFVTKKCVPTSPCFTTASPEANSKYSIASTSIWIT